MNFRLCVGVCCIWCHHNRRGAVHRSRLARRAARKVRTWAVSLGAASRSASAKGVAVQNHAAAAGVGVPSHRPRPARNDRAVLASRAPVVAQWRHRVTLAALQTWCPFFAAELRLKPVPNFSWCGRAGSVVPFLGTTAARRTARR